MRVLFCILCFVMFACESPKPQNALAKFNESTKQKPFSIVVSYSNECPVCILYTSVLKEILQELPKDSFQCIFLKVNATEEWDFLDTTFIKHSKIQVSAIESEALEIAGSLGISMFPEVVVLDDNGRKLYSGAIDNRVKELGAMHFRPNQSEAFLKNAIQQIRNHRDVAVSHAPAKGCYIEFPKKP